MLHYTIEPAAMALLDKARDEARGLRILVCGGRDFTDYDGLKRVLNDFFPRMAVLIHGDCRGADKTAGQWAQWAGVPIAAYPVNHAVDGPWPGAGPRRNRRMLAHSKAEMVIAFPSNGPGTARMVEIADAASVPVVKVERA